MKILVYLEVQNGNVRRTSLEAVAAALRVARDLGGEVIGSLVGGGDMVGLGSAMGSRGLARVMVTRHQDLAAYSQEGYAQAVAAQAREAGATHVFFSHTAFGKDLAPRVAQKLDAGMAGDVVALMTEGGRLVAERPMYAGRVVAQVGVTGERAVFTLRPKIFPAGETQAGKTAEVTEIPFTPPPGGIRAVLKGIEAAAAGMVDLTEADFIVSGGRGVKGPEGFKPLEELARVLGAAVGASRAAVDAGWRPHADQVGQTGKTVSPTLYVACGISGAIQHLAGMGSSKVIVAINKDPNAPIFEKADYGIVGDLFEVVPRLTAEVKKLKAAGE